ncbi:Protein kish-A [Golovinomyces cichoracearum]|uniref:Protein kish-A n=1 Tax=Golovinomyces cichoracearum TaxID=62708 RepID=A0A420H9J4_9PEZI|nr:Protein kish-A [Golovinomyces cichoracearum]
MSALFNFQSALLVLLLIICTSAYCHQLFPSFMDRNKQSYVYTNQAIYFFPYLSQKKKNFDQNLFHKLIFCLPVRPIWGSFWKAARIGERLSPYISFCCVIFALSMF